MRKNKENKFAKNFMVVFISLVMVTSVFGVIFYGFNDPSSKHEYNGFKFERTNDGWKTKINGKEYDFYFLPEEVENIETADLQLNDAKMIDITSDEESLFAEQISLAGFILAQEMDKNNVFIRQGFLENNSYSVPVIPCRQTDYPVIYFMKSNQTKIDIQDCIVAEAQNDFDVLRLKDRIEYEILGVME